MPLFLAFPLNAVPWVNLLVFPIYVSEALTVFLVHCLCYTYVSCVYEKCLNKSEWHFNKEGASDSVVKENQNKKPIVFMCSYIVFY